MSVCTGPQVTKVCSFSLDSGSSGKKKSEDSGNRMKQKVFEL